MEIVPSNSENDDQPRVNRCKGKRTRCRRKRTTLNESKSASSSNKAIIISLRNSKSSHTTKAAKAAGGYLEAPPRAIGVDGHFYECVKCNEVGSLICCDTCACTYHYECLDPPLESIPDGDWFCQNCSEDGNLSDSTVNHINAGSSSKRRRRSLKRSCKVKVSSGCCLCRNIKKKLIPDENDFFSFKTKSTAQSNLSNRGQPSARNDDAVGGTIIQHNTNNGDKHLVLRPRKRAEGNRIEPRKTGEMASSTQAAEKDQDVDLRPRRRGRPPGKRRTGKGPSTVADQQNEQQQQNQKPCLTMVLYGANQLPPEYAAAIKAAHEAAARNAGVHEIPWSGVELDALWVGVRRHGPDNWDTILEDPNLSILVLCKKTFLDLTYRWQQELEKMYSIVKTSGFLPSPPTHEPLDQTPKPAILNGEATAQQLLPPPQIPVTSTESGPLVPNHQGSSSSSASIPAAAAAKTVSNGEGGGQPVDQTSEPAILDGEATAQQIPVITSTESASLVPNHQGLSSSSSIPPAAAAAISNGEAGGEPMKADTYQQLSPPEIPVASPQSGASGPNYHQGTSSSSSLRDSPSAPRACDDIAPLIPVAAVVSNGEAGGGERIEANTQQHFAVSSPESGALVVGRNDHQGSSASSIPRACVTVAVAPPQWRPNLNLHPVANHLLFEAFQRRAKPETQMINHMGVEAVAPGRVAMAVQTPPANTTVRPNLFLDGCFPVRNRYQVETDRD